MLTVDEHKLRFNFFEMLQHGRCELFGVPLLYQVDQVTMADVRAALGVMPVIDSSDQSGACQQAVKEVGHHIISYRLRKQKVKVLGGPNFLTPVGSSLGSSLFLDMFPKPADAAFIESADHIMGQCRFQVLTCGKDLACFCHIWFGDKRAPVWLNGHYFVASKRLKYTANACSRHPEYVS